MTPPANSASPGTLFKGYSITSSQMNATATTDAASPSLTVFPLSCTVVSSPCALPSTVVEQSGSYPLGASNIAAPAPEDHFSFDDSS
jgi:hypothetical protein